MASRSIENPFAVKTPEDISGEEALRLFVDVFTDFHKVRDPGHCIVNGPRGCGKSMMFRYLLPDCQQLASQCSLAELPFFAVLVSIKNTNLNFTELRRLVKHHAAVVLNEHLLTTFVASKTFGTLATECAPIRKREAKRTVEFGRSVMERLAVAGWRGTVSLRSDTSVPALFTKLQALCDQLYREAVDYVRRLTFAPNPPPTYTGPLCGYLDFLVPLLEEARSLPYTPRGPVYLLVDDADYLNNIQTRVLNSWISTRTAQSISVKVSSQQHYKTYQTTAGSRIEAPHDYSDINISDLYTNSHSKYMNRVREIVAKRLRAAGIDRSPDDFFPPDIEQEREVKQIAARLKREWPTKGRGAAPADDATRYARPTFMADLKGTRKAGSTYSYAGFSQLVHISSGLIRYFLEPAAQMFNEQRTNSDKAPKCISPSVQDGVIRKVAEDLMLTGYDRMFADGLIEGDRSATEERSDRKARLHNLLRALGGIFHLKLISTDSERRVFSVAFSDVPDPAVIEIFDLGVELGYFHQSTIGNKQGTGRTPLFVLTRRLAPYFNLDPTGFAGYLFVTNEKLKDAIADPERFLRQVKSKGVSRSFEERQLRLFA